MPLAITVITCNSHQCWSIPSRDKFSSKNSVFFGVWKRHEQSIPHMDKANRCQQAAFTCNNKHNILLKTLTSMARKTVADIPSATWYSFLSFTCVTLFSNDVVNILKIYQTPQKSEYAKLSILYIKTIMKMWLASIALNKFLSYKMHMFVMFA